MPWANLPIYRAHMQRLSRRFHNHLISQFENSSRVKFVIGDFHKADELTEGKTFSGYVGTPRR